MQKEISLSAKIVGPEEPIAEGYTVIETPYDTFNKIGKIVRMTKASKVKVQVPDKHSKLAAFAASLSVDVYKRDLIIEHQQKVLKALNQKFAKLLEENKEYEEEILALDEEINNLQTKSSND